MLSKSFFQNLRKSPISRFATNSKAANLSNFTTNTYYYHIMQEKHKGNVYTENIQFDTKELNNLIAL